MGFADDLPSPDDEAPQQSTVGLSGYSTPSIPTFLPQAPTNLLSNVKGKDLFDATIWKDKKSTQTHYTFITSLKHKIDEVQDTSEVHKFIRVLRDGGRLVRNYTQNIDMLEKREGLCTDLSRGVGSKGRFNPKLRKESREGQDHEGGKFDNGVEVVQLHGNLEYLRCTLCLQLCDWEKDDRHLTMLSGEAPPCPHCIKKTETRQEKGRRGLSVGTLRPDIVLYGENNPHDAAIGDLSTHDIKIGPDMCIILGTSLKVHGLKLLLREFSKAVHDRGGKVIFVNNTKPPDSVWGDVIDYWVEWDCDAWVRDVKTRREGIWTPQGSSPETTPKLQHKQLPGCVPKPQPKVQNGRKVQVPIPKHPQCMRIDYFCGAYIMDKIQRTLRAQSGRGEVGNETKAIQARIDQINLQLMRSGKAAEKLALAAAETALEATKAARRERRRRRTAEKRALDRETAKELEEEANDEAAAAQLQLELEPPALSELPNMWNTTVQAMRKITFDPAWDSSHPIQPTSFEIHCLLEKQGWTCPSERDAAHALRLADLVKDHERPADERAPTRLESQAILFPHCNITGKRKRETPSVPSAPPAPLTPLPRPTPAREQFSVPLSSPVSLASDKSNMAHITWNILGNVSQELGRERTIPDTIAGQRTLFAELGREFTELLPPPTPAAAYALSNYSISPLRPSTPTTPNEGAASQSSASSLLSQDPNGSNRNNSRSVFEHSRGMVSRLPRMGALDQPLTGADNARYGVRYMSAAPTPSAEERDVSLSNAEPQLNAEAGIAFSPPSALPTAVSHPAPILASSSVSQALSVISANASSPPQSNEPPSQPTGVQIAAPNPPPPFGDRQDARQEYTTSHGILFRISLQDFKKIDRMIKRCRFGLSLFNVCTCGLEALAEEERGAERWNLTDSGKDMAARRLHLHDYRHDAIALLGSPMDISKARRIVQVVMKWECREDTRPSVTNYKFCFNQPVVQPPKPSEAAVATYIADYIAMAHPEHGCNCPIHAYINQWLLESKLLDLNGWGAMQLNTPLHAPEYVSLAGRMIMDQGPDQLSYSNPFASILGMTLDEDTFKRCHQVGRAPKYARPQEIIESDGNANPAEPPSPTPLEGTQAAESGERNSLQKYAEPSQPIPSQMPAPSPPQPNTTGTPNTPQTMAPFSMAPFLHLTGEIYVPPYDITRAAQFGMTPTPIPFNTQYGQLPTPAPTPPTAVDLREEIAKLQRERNEHRDAVNIQGRAWTLLERRHDEGKEKRIAELEYQFSDGVAGQERFLTPPDSDERSQGGSQYGGSQPSLPGYAPSVGSQGFTAEQLESGFPVVKEVPLAGEMESPMTPKAKRIKSMGSIEAVFSSPPPLPPTLSRETENLMDEEKAEKVEYPKLNAMEQKELVEEYPAVENRKEPITKRKKPVVKNKESALNRRRRASRGQGRA